MSRSGAFKRRLQEGFGDVPVSSSEYLVPPGTDMEEGTSFVFRSAVEGVLADGGLDTSLGLAR